MKKSNRLTGKKLKEIKTFNLSKVSIIIPVYNAEEYLEKCLDSIFAQTLKNIEIICVNDSSTDNSLKILKKYEKSGIKILTTSSQMGQAHARNIGIDIANGEYIGFVDADDYADITMFEKMYKKAKKDNADIEICEAVMYDDSEKKIVSDDYFTLKCFPETFDNKVFNAEDTVDFIENINVTLWNKIYKTSFLKENKIKFSEGYIYEDMPFIYEVYAKAERIGILRESLYYYRVNTKNSTMTKSDKKVLDRVDMVEKSLEIFKNLPYFEKIRGKILNWAIHDIYYRYTLIDWKYQKEYFFKMQNLFKNIDVTGVEDSLLLDPYYPYFCEIPKRNYDESVKYFANKDTFYDPYLDSIKNMKAEYEYQLEQKAEEIYKTVKEEYDKLLDNTPLNDYHENFESEKQEICNNYEKVIAELKGEFDNQQTKFSEEKQEICDNYEKIIGELKDNILRQQDKFAGEKQEICDNYEKVINDLKSDIDKNLQKKADEVYINTKKECDKFLEETIQKYNVEKDAICNDYEKKLLSLKTELEYKNTKFVEEKQEICDNYEKVIKEIKDYTSTVQQNFGKEKQEICDNYERIIREIKEYSDTIQNKFENDNQELCKNYDNLQKKAETEKKELKEYYMQIIKELKSDFSSQRENFMNMLKEQINISKINYKQVNSYKNKIENEEK